MKRFAYVAQMILTPSASSVADDGNGVSDRKQKYHELASKRHCTRGGQREK
jgi:hypothetical protein